MVSQLNSLRQAPGRRRGERIPSSVMPPLHCEILARRPAQAGTLAEILQICATDLGQTITLESHAERSLSSGPVVTLHLPAEVASSQNQVWCLACRLACFCPEARISVLISARDLFSPVSTTTSKLQVS